MLVTLSAAKIQLEILEDDDDICIEFCIDSAVDIVQRHIDKKMVLSFEGVDQELIDSGKVILFSPGLERAILMLITHLFENRGMISDEPMRVVPMGYRYILDQYRTPGIG